MDSYEWSAMPPIHPSEPLQINLNGRPLGHRAEPKRNGFDHFCCCDSKQASNCRNLNWSQEGIEGLELYQEQVRGAVVENCVFDG
jgi:hypothetical protein